LRQNKLHIALYQPEIPPNTGNIIRLAANSGAALHLIAPFGFSLDEKRVRRAGLDYHALSQVSQWRDWQHFIAAHGQRRLLALSTRGQQCYSEVSYGENDVLLFGPETRGLPASILDSLPAEQRLRIPMQNSSRSLNLSNAVAIVLYEALRQQGFAGLK